MIFQIFKKRSDKKSTFDFSHIGTDIHSHLVPGVDDGADSVETSIKLIEGLLDLGYKKLVTTPHIHPDYYPNNRTTLMSGFNKLQQAVKSKKLLVELGCAAEYYVDFDFNKVIETGDLLTFNGNYLLVEISMFSQPPNLFENIFQARIKGYQPIMAHPERYVYCRLETFEKMKDFGCLLQINALSLSGHYGKEVKDLALKLLKNKLIDLLGTDLHHERHLDALRQMTTDDKIVRILSEYEFQNATIAAN